MISLFLIILGYLKSIFRGVFTVDGVVGGQKNWLNLVGKFWCTHRIAWTLYHLTIICFGLSKTSLMEKNWPTKEQPKTMLPSFSPLNHKSSIPMELWNYPKNGKRSTIIMAHMGHNFSSDTTPNNEVLRSGLKFGWLESYFMVLPTKKIFSFWQIFAEIVGVQFSDF